MKKTAAFFVGLLFLTHCKYQSYSLDTLPSEYIQIGSYGGFAGNVTTYFYFPNGQRFIAEGIGAGDGVSSSNEIEPFTSKEYKEMRKELNNNRFLDMKYNEVGNMTYFIRLKTKKLDHTVQWKNVDIAPAFLITYYNSHTKHLRKEAIN